MPKEYVYSTLDPREFVYADGTKVADGRPPFRARVAWNRETGHVDIATVDENDGQDGSGFFVELDRRGINDLIRHLRRARDAAFGRDE